VLLVPVAELPAEVRRRLAGEAGDWAITRPGLRTPSRIVDAGAAQLLSELRSPGTLVEAVLRYSRARGLDPEATLAAAFPLLSQLLDSGFLVPEGEGAILPSLVPGDEVEGFRVIACVQSLDDTEVYQVQRGEVAAALKIERQPGAGRRFEREAAILRHLGLGVTPRLLAEGDLGGRHYVAVEWFPGVSVTAAAAELRPGGAERLALCGEVLASYSRLHERGVLHGDVHPGNVLVAADGSVRLIDFGLAQWEGVRPGRGRGGVPFYFEPEYAAAVGAESSPPALSAAGEQHAVAALLYLLSTGAHYRDFSLEKNAMLRQIAEDPPLPFAERGVPAWPEVEAVLARALAKEPGERFPTLAAMAAAWEGIAAPAAAQPRDTIQPGAADRVLTRVLARLAPEGPLFAAGLKKPPRASVESGGAGIAYALYRIALAREDAALLSTADLWAARAVAEKGEAAFYDTGELTVETVGRVSPYHAATGPPAVQALLAHALGEPAVLGRALEAFLAAARLPGPCRDLTLGRSGLLLAAAILLGILPGTGLEGRPLVELGEELLAGLWAELDSAPALSDLAERPNLGMAHGWAGDLYASLRWCQATGSPLPESLAERLAALAGRAEPWGRGLRWRWYGGGERAKSAGSMPGWCNGSAGFVHLFTLAHEILGDPRYAALALGAAWNAWESPDQNGSLCCGLAGRAYALLHLHRHGGGAVWLARARQLAESAAADLRWAEESPDSLYKGEVGLAVLAADLARPEGAAMPFFADEGWPA
jgi:serine/threonine-protein kinase